jgi:PBSX family phage terminase large subunit
MAKLRFEAKDFNDQFFEIYNQLEYDQKNDEFKNFILIYGGSGSGKSYLAWQLMIMNLVKETKRCLVIRKTASTLDKTCIDVVLSILRKWGIKFKRNKVAKTITLENGSEFFFTGCEDPEELKGIDNIDYCVLEECTQLTETDFSMIISRIRNGVKESQIFLLFNPVSDQNWVYKFFWERTDRNDDFRVHHSTYKNNKFIHPNLVKILEDYQLYNPLYYQILCLGVFGTLTNGGECYRFDVVKNFELQKQYEYDDTSPIIISFDQNMLPYNAVVCGQYKGDVFYVFKEFALEGKNFEETVMTVFTHFSNHQNEIILVGDASIRNGSSMAQRGYNGVTKIKEIFAGVNSKINFKSRNDTIYLRIMFMNKMFAEGRVVINSECKKLINDLLTCPWSETGKEKSKKMYSMKVGDETKKYQKFAHMSDATDYLVLSPNSMLDKEFQRFLGVTKDIMVRSEAPRTAGY